MGACRIPALSNTHVSLGFPRAENRLPSVGEIEGIVLFVDFPDVPAAQNPEDIFAALSPGSEEYFKVVSKDRLALHLMPHLVWLRMEMPANHYGDRQKTHQSNREFIQEAINLADPEVDFSIADTVIVIANPEAADLEPGVTTGMSQASGISVDGVVISNALSTGSGLLDYGFLLIVHEIGHNLGLVDLYQTETEGVDQRRYVGEFGIMGGAPAKVPEHFALEQWMLGWLEDDQIICQESNDLIVTISALEIEGGVKAVIIPVGPSNVVVVESRRPIRYDHELEKPGVLVYFASSLIRTGNGPIIVYPQFDDDPFRARSPLGLWETVTVEGVTITVLEATEFTDMVHITVAN
jgi:M6 family metalloprotease-like protein